MYKARAINTHITALKDLFKYLERKGFTNYAKGVKKEKTDNNFTRDSLTLEQVKGIYNSIDTSTLEGARANALFRLLFGKNRTLTRLFLLRVVILSLSPLLCRM